MTEFDGKRQRNALTAAERALRGLGAGDAQRALRTAAKAAELDQLGLFAGLSVGVDAAVADLEATGGVGDESWDRLEVTVGPGPLQFLIRDLRG